MALQISARISNVKALLCSVGGPLSSIRADFQTAGVKFKHFLSPGSPQLGAKPATSPLRGHINAALRADKFSTTAAFRKPSQGSYSSSSSPRLHRGWLGKLTLGAALGLSSAALVQSLHTGAVTAMALTVNLDSVEGDWKKTKDFLLSLSVKDRRSYYRTSGFVLLDDVPVWTPAPANNSLLGGGGVDGAIHRAAGPLLKKECATLHGCETGEAKITCGYGLPAKYVIHTVGPIAHGGVGEKERNALRSCYRNSLTTATENGVRSVAFPCISTGVYGYPPEQAVHEVLATVREYLDENHDKLDRVIFCVFLPTDKELYLHNLPLYFPGDATVKSKL
ncbi:ADP-ribose glycohydrolase MACROD1 isoform 3-T3 [Pholidichthys leucotaenia]